MKKTTKVLALLCAVVLLVGLMAACGAPAANSPTPPAGDATTPPADATTPASSDLPTIVWWQIGTQPQNLEAGVAKINEYIADKIGAKLEIKVAGWGDYDTKSNTIVNTGEAFDILFVNNTNYNRFNMVGAFADITDLVQSDAPNLYSFIPEKVWDGTRIGGKIYAVPTYKDSSLTQYYVWDDQYVQKYNIDITKIKTLQDLDKPLRDIKAGEGKSFYPMPLGKADGFNGLVNDYDDMTLGFKPIGVKINDPSKKVVSVFEQPEMMENLKLLHSWYNDGIINSDAPTLDDTPKTRAFFSAQAFPGAEVNYQINEGVEKYVMQDIFGPMYTTSTIQGSMNAISANSQHKTECIKFLELANTDPQLRNMLAYGIEGENWKTVSDNVIERINDVWTLPAYSQASFFTMASVSPNPPDQWDAVKALNERADASVILGFVLDVSSLTTEVANCNAVFDKYKFELLTGASDPETTVPKMIAELKAAGMDTIMTEAQKQVDAFGQ